jgi:integrase/recombinase XerD
MPTLQKKVADSNKRKHTVAVAKHWLGLEGKKTMAKQAKTLNQTELRKVLSYIETRKHVLRNRAMLLMTHLAGLRVGEVAALRYKDVVGNDGKVKSQIYLQAEQTKGSEGRIVFISQRLRKELEQYVTQLNMRTSSSTNQKFFYSQKRSSDGFTSNTLTQYFHYLYRRTGIDGASSHSGRRSFATTIASQGVGIKVLQKLLGHKNIQTTSVYIYASDDMLRKAVELA